MIGHDVDEDFRAALGQGARRQRLLAELEDHTRAGLTPEILRAKARHLRSVAEEEAARLETKAARLDEAAGLAAEDEAARVAEERGIRDLCGRPWSELPSDELAWARAEVARRARGLPPLENPATIAAREEAAERRELDAILAEQRKGGRYIDAASGLPDTAREVEEARRELARRRREAAAETNPETTPENVGALVASEEKL